MGTLNSKTAPVTIEVPESPIPSATDPELVHMDKCYSYIMDAVNDPIITKESICWILNSGGIFPNNLPYDECLAMCKENKKCYGIFHSDGKPVAYNAVRKEGLLEFTNTQMTKKNYDNLMIQGQHASNFEFPCNSQWTPRF